MTDQHQDHTSPKRVLVTGASGAVGFSTCEALVARGHHVAGTMRSRGGKNQQKMAALEALGVKTIAMDVTDDASVDAGVAAAIEALGGLDVVFNNAGIGSYGIQEMFSPQEMHRVFDVNVYGVQRVMRAVLPHLRGQRSGTIVYTSSLIGRISIPFYATYCASKWALEAIAQSYRAELSRFGIDSCIVEPGALPTPFLDGMLQPADTHLAADYADEVAALAPSLRGMQEMLLANPLQRPELVAHVVAALIDTPVGEKPFRVVADQSGMGEYIEGYNTHLSQVTRGVYTAFGNGEMLRMNPDPTAANA